MPRRKKSRTYSTRQYVPPPQPTYWDRFKHAFVRTAATAVTAAAVRAGTSYFRQNAPSYHDYAPNPDYWYGDQTQEGRYPAPQLPVVIDNRRSDFGEFEPVWDDTIADPGYLGGYGRHGGFRVNV